MQDLNGNDPPGDRPIRRWPLFLIAAPAAVSIWSGWVGLGELCGFGIVHPLPGIADGFALNTAITLPVGVEAYGAYALGAWMAPGRVPQKARRFARRSAIGALLLGMAGQVIFHLLAAAHAVRAPWPVVVLVSCMPVVVLGFGAALTHLLRAGEAEEEPSEAPPRQVSLPLFTDAMSAAMVAQQRAVEGGNPFTANALATKFGLPRARATEVVEAVAAQASPALMPLPSLNGDGR